MLIFTHTIFHIIFILLKVNFKDVIPFLPFSD